MAVGESETENSPVIPDETGDEERETKPGAQQQSTTSEVGETVRKQLIVAVEGTAAVGAFWRTIFSEYLEKIIRCFCGNKTTDEKHSKDLPELSLIMFTAHGPYSACLVQRSGWTTNMEVFFQWLSALPFVGGGFSDAAIAEGLAEALMCAISLSVICPKQLPKLRGIYNAVLALFVMVIGVIIVCPVTTAYILREGCFNGKHDPLAADPAVDNVKNPQFLVLISENFMDSRASLNRTGTADLPSNPSPAKADELPIPSISVPSPVPYLSDNTIASVVPLGASGAMVPTPAMSQQQQSDMQCAAVNSNNPTAHAPVPQPPSSALQSAEPKYVKVWEGDLHVRRQGQSFFVTKLMGYGKASSKTLAENWPPAIRIDQMISRDYMSNKKCTARADHIGFQAMNQHDLLVELHEKKLCAVIGLPSQTMFLGGSDKVQRLIGMVFPLPMSRGYRRQQQNHQQQQMQSQMQQEQETQQK